MQLEKQEQIKKLINNSSILDETEKQEWLRLLEVMNDKQVLELERILAPAAPAPEVSLQTKSGTFEPEKKTDRPEPLFVQQKKENIPTPAETSPVLKPGINLLPVKPLASIAVSTPPSLKHILNRPQAGGRLNLEPQKNTSSAPVSSLIQKGIKIDSGSLTPSNQGFKKTVPNAGFFNRIKNALKEKDLPAGHKEPTEEVLLQSPEALKPKDANFLTPKSPAQTFSKPPPVVPIKPKPGALQKPVIAILEKKETRTESDMGAGGMGNPLKPEIYKPKTTGFKSAAEVLGDMQAKKEFSGTVNEKVDKFFSGIQLPKIQSGIATKNGSVSTPVAKEGKQVPHFKSPQELKNLKTDELLVNLPELKKNIFKLVEKYGVYEVINSLEQSEVYNAYINTGAAILQSKGDFMQLASFPGGGFLSQGQFEYFADLLIELQTI